MPKAKSDTVSAAPLFTWFDANKGNRAKLRSAGYSDGRITNWRKRGIPRAEVGDVAHHMGLSYEDYLAATGSAIKGSHGLQLAIEEAQAIKRLKSALPAWRAYVLGLAMVDSKETQTLLLKTMQQAVPDKRVEEFIPVAPHAAARKQKVTR